MNTARLARLGDHCEQDRITVRPGEGAELRYIGLETIESGTGAFLSGELSKTPEVPQANSFRFGPQHVLYGKLRPYLNKVAVPDFEGKCSTEIIPLKPRAGLDRRYLSFFLRSARVVNRISKRTAGARMPRADMDFVLDLEIPLPPIDVQRRIVDLVSRAEGIVRLRREAQAKAAEIIPALFLDMFGDPVTNPKGWPDSDLDSLLTDTKLGLVRGAKEMGQDRAYAYLRMDAVGDGLVRLHDLRHVDASPKEVEAYALKVGDVLFNTRNSRELVGKTGLVTTTPGAPVLFNNNLMRMRFDEKALLPVFVNWQFQTPHVQRQLEAIKRGTTTVFAIYYKDLKDTRLRVPPIELQERFAALALAAESVMAQQADALKKAEVTFQALLARSFRDDLTYTAAGKEAAVA